MPDARHIAFAATTFEQHPARQRGIVKPIPRFDVYLAAAVGSGVTRLSNAAQVSRKACDGEFLRELEVSCQLQSRYYQSLCEGVALEYYIGVRAVAGRPLVKKERTPDLGLESLMRAPIQTALLAVVGSAVVAERVTRLSGSTTAAGERYPSPLMVVLVGIPLSIVTILVARWAVRRILPSSASLRLVLRATTAGSMISAAALLTGVSLIAVYAEGPPIGAV